ncbi:MAG: AAA family ATPase, partial [Fimbriimonadaceae bacterium]
QFIIATHSPILLGYGDSLIYRFAEQGIEPTSYRETDHYRLTLDFLKNRERYVNLLGLDPD